MKFVKGNRIEETHWKADLISDALLEEFKKYYTNEEYGGRKNTMISQNIGVGLRTYDGYRRYDGSLEHVPVKPTFHTIAALGGTKSVQIKNVVEPNLKLANQNYVIMDEDGVLYNKYKEYLEENGYDVLLYEPFQHQDEYFYNFFKYIYSDDECEAIAQMLVENYHENGNDKSDWKFRYKKFLISVIAVAIEYVYTCVEKEQQGINTFVGFFDKVFDGNKNVLESYSLLEDHFKTLCMKIVETNPSSKVMEKCEFITKKKDIFGWHFPLTSAHTIIDRFYQCDGCKNNKREFQADTLELESFFYKKRAIFIYTAKDDFMYDQVIAVLCFQIMNLFSYKITNAQLPIHYLELPNGEFVCSESLNGADIDERKKELQNISVRKNEKMGMYDIVGNSGDVISRRKTKEQADQYISDISNVSVKETCGVPTYPLFALHLDILKFPTEKDGVSYLRYMLSVSRLFRLGFIFLISDTKRFYDMYKHNNFVLNYCWYKVYFSSEDSLARQLFMGELLKSYENRGEYERNQINKNGLCYKLFKKQIDKKLNGIDMEEKENTEKIRQIVDGLDDSHCLISSFYPLIKDVKITEDSADK